MLSPIVWRMRLHVPNALASAGLLGYARQGPTAAEHWDEQYASGEGEREADLAELAHYGVLIAYVEHLRAGRILDIGCGVGLLRERLTDRSFDRYVGVDPSGAALERAQRLADERTAFVLGERIPPDRGPFDVVVCNEMLYYVEDPDEFLDYVKSMLQPGGYVLTSIWRHPRDVLLHKTLDRHFDLVDRVEIVQRSGPVRPIWRVACHRKRA